MRIQASDMHLRSLGEPACLLELAKYEHPKERYGMRIQASQMHLRNLRGAFLLARMSSV